MRSLLLILSVLILAGLATWVTALRRGPGEPELHVPRPWPRALEPLERPTASGRLAGQLRQADGSPAVEALVQTTTTEGERRLLRWAWTDRSGRFELTGLDASPQRSFVVLAPEHMPQRFELDLSPGTPVDALSWTLAPPTPDLEPLPELDLGPYTGSVRRASPADGDLEDLEVLLLPIPGPGADDDPDGVLALLAGRTERRARLGSDGTYTVAALAAGFYEVVVLPSWARGGTWPVLGRGVLEHAPGTGRPSFPVVLEEARLSGTVRGSDGQPLGAALLLVTSGDRVWPPAHSDAAGRFELGELEPGGYHLELVAGGEGLELDLLLEAGERRVLDLDLAPLD